MVMEAGRAFGLNVDKYQDFRPRPPEAVFDVIIGAVGDRRRHAVDLGAGTGHASEPLLPRFDRVTAVEIDAVMAATLTRLGENLEVVVSPAEEAAFDAGSIDLVTAAMSFHWMDRDLVAENVSGWLRPGGIFALYGYASLKFPDVPPLHEMIETERYSRWTHFFPHDTYRKRHEDVLADFPIFSLATEYVPHFVLMSATELTGHMASTSTGGAWARSTGDVTGYWDDFLVRLEALDMKWPAKVDFSKEIILARKRI